VGNFNSNVFNPNAPGGTQPGAIAVSDLVIRALRLIQVMGAPGRGYSSEELIEALSVLNVMVDAWNVEALMVYVRLRQLFTINASQQVYQIGNGAPDWNTAPDDRPSAIPAASIIITTSGQNTEVPIEPLTWERWQQEAVKQLPCSYPIKFWYDYQFPFGNVWVWPTPTQTNQMALYIPQLLKSAFSQPTDSVVMPQGYQRALSCNLAVELAPGYPKAVVSPLLLQRATDSKADVKRANMRILEAAKDPAIMNGARRFNVWTGQYQP
jgi:hypothetical protein